MKAIVLKSFGSVDELEEQELPLPELGPGEVLVQTKAIGINPVDAKTRKGKGQAERLKNEHPIILGWDISGAVVKVAADVTEFKEGDQVFGMINIPGHGRAYAEFVAAKAVHLAAKPSNVSHEEAAAASLAAVTAYQALVRHASIQPGQKILIHAAAGGVGHFAVQIAKHLQAYVIGTSSADNEAMVMDCGANETIDYRKQPFEEVSPQVDWILDTIGGDNIARSLKVLKPGGTIISLPSGISETVGVQAAEQGKKGVFFMTQSNGDDIRQIAAWLAAGVLRPHVSRIFRFDQMKAAHEQIESGKTRGKIVVTC